MEMAETKVNQGIFYGGWAVLAAGAALALCACFCGRAPKITWRYDTMDGHRTGATCVTSEHPEAALGTFDDEGYVTPSGVRYADDSPVTRIALSLSEVQPRMAHLKEVVGHSAREMQNLRTQPDLPLGNLFADVLRARGSKDFRVPMDFAITNYGGIRVPMPKGAVTLEDITSMFPFKNYMCWCEMKGRGLISLFEQLAGTLAFQPISGARVVVKDHQLVSAEIGGKPIDPDRVYHVTSIDFLLDGGDKINLGALSEKVTLSHVLLKDVMLDYIRDCEAKGIVIDAASDGRVIMEESSDE